MKLSELTILLPCHSLDDFPTHHEGADAEGLLSGWSCLWHPALIAAAGSAPKWHRADDPPESFAERLLVVPEVSRHELPAGLMERAESEGALVLAGMTDRPAMLAMALDQLESGSQAIAPDLVEDFLALAYCYLEVELLTRQMRYMSNVDEVYFQNETVAAALAAARGEVDEAHNHLTACFDILAQARDQFYPVDSYLIDLVLVAPTTMGRPLREELESDSPTNLLASAELIERMAQQEPETLAALRRGLQQGTASLVGGEYTEDELPFLSHETILSGFEKGREVYERHLGQSPRIFGRRTFGLYPSLPQILSKLGFTGALHLTFDGGRFPQGEQGKTRWEGHDGSAIDALARMPLDAAKPDAFLGLSRTIGETMDMDHVATVLFARWPGQWCTWYHDLRRIARFGPALGKFVTLDEYFSTTDMPSTMSRFEADEYQAPYLRQAVAAGVDDPISRTIAAWQAAVERETAQTVLSMRDFVKGRRALDATNSSDRRQTSREAALQFAESLDTANSSLGPGYLILNPTLAERRFEVELPDLPDPPDVKDHVRASGRRGDLCQAVVDVPAMGFAWVGAGSGSSSRRSKQVALAEENLLRNEHLEVVINPTTGGIQAVRQFERRGNRLSQQIAFRRPSPRQPSGSAAPPLDPAESYSIMAADEITVTAASEAMGEIVSRGRLMDRQGNPLAGFEQRMQIWRGSRVLRLQVTLTPDVPPGPKPWDSYYAFRFAWPDPAAHVWRSAGMASHPTVSRRIEAPHFLEIREPDHRVVLLTGGLPYHVRSGERHLDTLLTVRGEKQVTFQFGIGLDVAEPMAAALELMMPAASLIAPAACPSSGPTGWLFHVQKENFVATHWEPLWETGSLNGFRARLLETSGKAGRAVLSAFRDVQKAVQTDLNGNPLCDLAVEEGKIRVDFAAYEWIQVDAVWK